LKMSVHTRKGRAGSARLWPPEREPQAQG
jgi:hypothetical protein